jgi:hypothetical protein
MAPFPNLMAFERDGLMEVWNSQHAWIFDLVREGAKEKKEW